MGDRTFRVAFTAYIIGKSDSPNVLAGSTAAPVVPLLASCLFGGVLPRRLLTDHHGFR
ncbi:hypothetical protein PUR49_25350 [Streptomyces sp. BE147]|uniref:hypothetical protein n=1 Tax=Streptomyces sp. BE147 TaxID=3002524 RepID=UPI002E7614FE|nr:hypothetical protein [Streptomyces sp. BE147]MEE1739805.1 hypothetical protein [Streptomyces sp. BE147]